MSERSQVVAVIALVVVSVIAYDWISDLVTERNELRDSIERAAVDLDAGRAQVDRLERSLAKTEARLPKEYKKGRAAGVAYTCNNVYGGGPTTVDTWQRIAQLNPERVDIRAIVFLLFEDGSKRRIARADCLRF